MADAASSEPRAFPAAAEGEDVSPQATFSDEAFRWRVGFLGVIGVAFACSVYLMTLLRPMLEPFLWALFLVMALHPLTSVFEAILQRLGSMCCGCKRRNGKKQRTRLEANDGGDASAAAAADDRPDDVAEQADGSVSPASSDIWRVPLSDEGDACIGCWACISRTVAVLCALALVLALSVGVAMLILNAALRVRDNFEVYELGARNAVNATKIFTTAAFGQMPRNIVDEITGNAQTNIKGLISGLLEEILGSAGRALAGLIMLALYVMFWLCAPIPLNTKTERIFRRYLFLKGASCLCYGACVGGWLQFLGLSDLSIVLGMMSFFLSFIPEVGAFIAMLLPAPVILFDSRLETPFVTFILATAGQLGLKFVFANIIEVKLVEKDSTMKMHPVITLLAVTFFGFIWGPTGMLLSVPIMAYVKVVIVSDAVPASYRDPILVLIEGDRRAPERYMRRLKRAAA